jgi:hypothetical protein
MIVEFDVSQSEGDWCGTATWRYHGPTIFGEGKDAEVLKDGMGGLICTQGRTLNALIKDIDSAMECTFSGIDLVEHGIRAVIVFVPKHEERAKCNSCEHYSRHYDGKGEFIYEECEVERVGAWKFMQVMCDYRVNCHSYKKGAPAKAWHAGLTKEKLEDMADEFLTEAFKGALKDKGD